MKNKPCWLGLPQTAHIAVVVAICMLVPITGWADTEVNNCGQAI